MAIDQYELLRQQMQEQAAASERARQQNVATFVRLFLGLGSDVQKIGGSAHDAELLEARSLASHRWSVLLSQEGQVQRDEGTLAGRPKKRPVEPRDELLPDRTIEARNLAWEEQTRSLREQLVALKELAKNERRELESYIVDFKKGR